MSDTKANGVKWWGRYGVAPGTATHWRIGPLNLRVERHPNEWRVVRTRGPNALDTRVEVEPGAPLADAPADVEVSRFGVSHDGDEIELSPVLPDRAVVTRPERPLVVPPREQVTMFVGCPLWVRVSEPGRDQSLVELPAVPPTKTFWGPNTREGEICYATRTWGRLSVGAADVFPHRVMASAKLVNHSDEPLLVERLRLPVRALSVYAASDGRLWTESMTLELSEGEELAELVIDDSPGPSAGSAERVSVAREPASTSELVRAFGRLFRF